MSHAAIRVGVVNPLPGALRHYVDAVSATLIAGGAEVAVLPMTSIERSQDGPGRLVTAMTSVREHRSLRRSNSVDRILVSWPAFGYLDFALWARRGTPLTVVVHDPAPLRRQFGLGRAATAVGRPFARGIETICHSDAAASELGARSWPGVHKLPLPMLPATPMWSGGQTVLVLGQFKDARDLSMMESLGPRLRARGLEPLVVGRGWPSVAGWNVRSEFVAEAEFEQLLEKAGCVLLPYSRVYQSDVAVRCAERGVPVVGPAESNVGQLFGSDWPGRVPTASDASGWESAIAAVLSVCEPGDVNARVLQSHNRALAAWHEWLVGSTERPSGARES